MTDPDLIGRSLLKLGYASFARNTQLGMSSTTEPCITLPEALETYVTQKGAVKPKTFKAAAKRACTYLVDACGTKTLAEYTRADALSYRDYLIARGLVGSSVSRVIISIRAVFNFAIFGYALDLKNPFVGMYFDKTAGVSKRLPIPIEDIRKVQHLFRKIDDDLRWLVALVSDTGMRLAEAAGLLKSDIRLNSDIPYRLCNAGVQSEMIDQLSGWSNRSVGQGYGMGYSLEALQNPCYSQSLVNFKFNQQVCHDLE